MIVANIFIEEYTFEYNLHTHYGIVYHAPDTIGPLLNLKSHHMK